MWSIWKARNLKLWQQVSYSTFTILERARHLLEGWRNANRKQTPIRQDNTPSFPSFSHHNGDVNFRWGNREVADINAMSMPPFQIC